MVMELHCLKDGSRFLGIDIQGQAQLSTCRTFKPNDYKFTSSGVNLKLNPKNGGTTPKKESPHYSYLLQAWREVCSDHKTTQMYTETPALSNKQLTRWGLQASVELTGTAYNYSRDQSLGRSRSPNGAMANWDAIPRPNHKCTHDDDGKGFPSIIPPNYASQRKSPKLIPDQTTSPKKPINLSSPKTADCEDTHKITPPNTLQKLRRRVEWGWRWWNELSDGYGYGCVELELVWNVHKWKMWNCECKVGTLSTRVFIAMIFRVEVVDKSTLFIKRLCDAPPNHWQRCAHDSASEKPKSIVTFI